MLKAKKCKVCRTLGQKILWNTRCASGKCALDRRHSRPGQHGQRMRQRSQYGLELTEKQKVRFYYLLREQQLRNFAEQALRAKEPAPTVLIRTLERKLGNVIWLAGYVPSKTTARQFIAHGHFLVNGRRIKSANYLVEPGDVIEIRPGSEKAEPLKDLADRAKQTQVPAWLKFDPQTFRTEVTRQPEPEEIQLPFNFGLIIDFYSRH